MVALLDASLFGRIAAPLPAHAHQDPAVAGAVHGTSSTGGRSSPW
jgi:hypothetical protein